MVGYKIYSQKKSWGEGIWEEKIRAQKDFEVAQGSTGTRKGMNERTKKVMEIIDSFFPPLMKKGKALDAGVGAAAPFLIEFSKRGFQVTGVDISKTTLNLAKERVKEYPKTRFIQDDITTLKKIKGKYDLVYCIGTFGHIPSFLAVTTLKSFNRVLEKNGICILHLWLKKEKNLRVVFYTFVYDILRIFKGFFKKTFEVNVSEYTKEEIIEIVRLGGFKIDKTSGDFFLLKKIIE